MPIAFSCSCGKAMKAKDVFAGRKVKCPQCGTVVPIPAAEVAPGNLPATAPLARPSALKQRSAAQPHAWVDQSLVQRPTLWLAGDEARFQVGIKAPREGMGPFEKVILGLLVLGAGGAVGWFLMVNK